MALIFGSASAPAFDVPIRYVSLNMRGKERYGNLTIEPGRCGLSASFLGDVVQVTARRRALHLSDMRSLLMVSLDGGYSATTWGAGDPGRPPGPSVVASVTALEKETEEYLGTLGDEFSWVNVLALTPEGRLTEAWRLYSVFSFCNLGEAVDYWVAQMDGPRERRHIALAVVMEWMIWANREEDFVYALPGLLKDCRAGRCEALPDALRRASLSWAESPSPRSFTPLERSPPVETGVSP
ncbi:hypothetical protein L6R49_04000 [Myxococcota bacterium]|nr:hypothetical protein [Myxococcota bacterium]